MSDMNNIIKLFNNNRLKIGKGNTLLYESMNNVVIAYYDNNNTLRVIMDYRYMKIIFKIIKTLTINNQDFIISANIDHTKYIDTKYTYSHFLNFYLNYKFKDKSYIKSQISFNDLIIRYLEYSNNHNEFLKHIDSIDLYRTNFYTSTNFYSDDIISNIHQLRLDVMFGLILN